MQILSEKFNSIFLHSMEPSTAEAILKECNFKQYKSTVKLKISPHYLKQLYEKITLVLRLLHYYPKVPEHQAGYLG